MVPESPLRSRRLIELKRITTLIASPFQSALLIWTGNFVFSVCDDRIGSERPKLALKMAMSGGTAAEQALSRRRFSSSNWLTLAPRSPRARCGPVARAKAEADAGAGGSEQSQSKQKRKPSPLEKGGTLSGTEAKGKQPGPAANKATGNNFSTGSAAPTSSIDPFGDSRWVNGTWDFEQFKRDDGKVDWDAVIDAEIERRRLLEINPAASTTTDPVRFTPNQIPWWAWMKRFHLPEAELVNGRAAMIGFVASYGVDALTGAGVVDQMGSSLGKLSLFLSVISIALVRNASDIAKYRNLINEAVFYDQQWDATWKESNLPKETEQ